MAKNKPQDDAVQKPLQDTPDNPSEQQEAQGGQTEQQPEAQDNLPENQPEQRQDYPDTPPETTQSETAPVEQQPEQDAVVQPTADAVAVRSRTERFFRCGLEFVRHEWRTVQRSELSDADWQRLLAEPHLEIRPADAPDDNGDVPQ